MHDADSRGWSDALLAESAPVNTEQEDHRRLDELRDLLDRSRRRGPRRLSAEELRALPRLYRFASSLHARLETRGGDPGTLEQTHELIGRAHSLLYRDVERAPVSPLDRLRRLFLVDSPQAIRAEWRMLLIVVVFFYGLAVVSYVAVTRHLDLAFTLFDPGMIAGEIEQLQNTPANESFRGNFTFGIGESPETAGWIMAHNMAVAVLFFAAGLVPPLFFYLMANNGLMLGTYTGVAAHWDQATSISSILWCHGVLELQALVLAGMAGLILVRAWIAPGPWSRREAMRRESRRSILVLAPVFPMLFCAGLIEGFISPHAPMAVRLTVAAVTGVALLYWVFVAGRGVPKTAG